MNHPTSYKVAFRKTHVYEGRKRVTNYVRWAVDGTRFQEGFQDSEAAESFRADLRSAANRGEAFSLRDGRPMSWPREHQQQSFYEFAYGYVTHRWPEVSAKQRQNMAETFMYATIAMLPHDMRRPDATQLRQALRSHAFNVHGREHIPTPARAILSWVEEHCRPVADLADPAVLRAVITCLNTKLDGTPRAVWSQKRQHAIMKTSMDWAVEADLLGSNPFAGRKRATVKQSVGIDKRRCLNHDQATRLISAAAALPRSGPTMSVFFAVMYYSGLRPEEAVDIRRSNIHLPRTNQAWGEIHLSTASPNVGSEWTDTRQPRDTRCLKQRAPGDTRTVPIPPPLVTILAKHITTKPGPENRLLRSHTGGILPAVTCRRAFATARANAFTPEEADSPLATRIYDLRHACLSQWFNSGIPATQVAEWAGNSPDILLRIYAKCIDGEQAIYKKRIEATYNTI